MKIHRAHKIELKPNKVQATFLLKSCGVARVGYNTALDIWNKELVKTREENLIIKMWKIILMFKEKRWFKLNIIHEIHRLK